jgi:hypothetical protein
MDEHDSPSELLFKAWGITLNSLIVCCNSLEVLDIIIISLVRVANDLVNVIFLFVI